MKYGKMPLDEFQQSHSYEREFKYKLEEYEDETREELIRKPYLSCRQIHDHLRERHPDFPVVSEKTVFYFVMALTMKPTMTTGLLREMVKTRVVKGIYMLI